MEERVRKENATDPLFPSATPSWVVPTEQRASITLVGVENLFAALAFRIACRRRGYQRAAGSGVQGEDRVGSVFFGHRLPRCMSEQIDYQIAGFISRSRSPGKPGAEQKTLPIPVLEV